MFKRIFPGIGSILIAFLLVGVVAAAPANLVRPSNLTVIVPSTPGTLNVSWDAVSGAHFYIVGWINMAEFQDYQDAGRSWEDAFHYATIPATYTSHSIINLVPGGDYYTIVAATMTRFGGENPTWSDWSDKVTTTPAPDPPPAGEVRVKPALELNPPALLIDENASKTFALSFTTDPAADVTIVIQSSNSAKAIATPTTLTVESGTANQSRTFTVHTFQDEDTEHEQVTLSITATSETATTMG
ncbi:MAG: fibronectin type III domain-containing protein [Chloroflexi bacterium]|nr:fibronectin type III domain-containing protein [Chloroflexota bacterium]